MVRACDQPLASLYDLALLDLDGVVYIGDEAVPEAPTHLAAARQLGMRLSFVTNNASRPPDEVACHLTRLGIQVDAAEVVTSAQAAARVLSHMLPAGSPVFVIGGAGLFAALRERALEPVQSIEANPVAVVSGYHPDLRWQTVIEGSILVRRGLPWVASNTDRSIPTPHGHGPGNGVIVAAVADFAERSPVVAGKPEPPLFTESVLRSQGERPLVVGDRLDTDIEGAIRSGYDSLLVMTGVTGLQELVSTSPAVRPTYLSADLGGLLSAHGSARDGRAGGWRAEVHDGLLSIQGEGSLDDWWRAVATVAWDYLDATGRPVVIKRRDSAGSVDVPIPGKEWVTSGR